MDEATFPATAAGISMLLLGIAAVSGIAAGAYWLNVARSMEADGAAIKGPDRDHLAKAAIFTGIALLMASFRFLLGRFTGSL